MARRQLADDEKRKQVAVRLSPQARERIARLAVANGTSVGAEVEQLALDQLAYLEETDEQTRALIAKIADKIAEMQKLAKGRWYKNLTAWAAVSQALSGILDSERPEKPSDDEFVAAVQSRRMEAISARSLIVLRLSELGFAVQLDPRPTPLLGSPRRLGMFGQTTAGGTSRTWEQSAIDAIPDEDHRKTVQQVFDQLRSADAKIEDLDKEWAEAMAPFWKAEQEGRKLGLGFDPNAMPSGLFNLSSMALAMAPRKK